MASPSRAPPTGVPRRTHLPSSHSASTRTRPTTNGSGTATPEGSLTTTITSLPTQPDGLVLRLRGAHEPQISETTETETGRRRHIQWAEGVIDNEGLGRKKSKVCCIYHKTREFGESSSEENSDGSSSSSDDESGDDGAARPVGGYARGGRGKGKGKGRKHELEDGNGCDGHGHGHGHDGEKGKRKPSPNAYERMPRYDVKPLHGQPGT